MTMAGTPSRSSLPVPPPFPFPCDVWYLRGMRHTTLIRRSFDRVAAFKVFHAGCSDLLVALVVPLLAAPAFARNPPQVVWAQQGWTAQEQDIFHYTAQGTVLANLGWFLALERTNAPGLLSSNKSLAEFGFMTQSATPLNPLGLPIGFATSTTAAPGVTTVGLTCSACHSGQLHYQGTSFRIDGTQSNANVNAFLAEYQASVILTALEPARFQRFAQRVLGAKSGDRAAVAALRLELDALAQKMATTLAIEEKLHINPTPSGPGRSDALDDIGNKVFGFDIQVTSNLHPANAPVNFPFLWDIWKLNWVQYNGSVTQAMQRNVGESLGVGAITNYVDAAGNPIPEPERWANTIPVENLYLIETQMQSLHAPTWPAAIFGAVDPVVALQGRALFETNCSSCHAPRPIIKSQQHFAKLAVTMLPLDEIGTDPTTALNAANYLFDGSKLTGLPSPDWVNTQEGLILVTEAAKTYAYDELGLTLEERRTLDGFGRPGLVRTTHAYKAKPLDGVWASAPYLHNGSVPTIYALLSPVAERPTTFGVGQNDYDPTQLGLNITPALGGFTYDTTLIGNSNAGHEFNDGTGNGVIGPKLTPAERNAIIAYLKLLPEMPPTPLTPVPLDWADWGW